MSGVRQGVFQNTYCPMEIHHMTDDLEYDVPVLIVGAGPAGLATAVDLARQGVPSLIVERRADTSQLPRATAVSTRSMELIRMWGLEAEVRAGAIDASWLMLQCESRARAGAGTAIQVGMPTPEQTVLLSPVEAACAPQDHLQAVMLHHLRDQAEARVEFATEVVSAENGPDGVRAACGTRPEEPSASSAPASLSRR